MTTADEKMREEFESEVLKADGHVGKLPCKTYSDPITASAWWAWQASAAQYSAHLKELEQSAQDEINRLDAQKMELEQQNEQLQAQVSMLRRQTKQLVECLHDVATGQDGWAYEEVISEAQDVMADTAQTAEAYKRRVQAKALEAAAQFFIEEPNSASRRAAKELDRMAAELKEGE